MDIRDIFKLADQCFPTVKREALVGNDVSSPHYAKGVIFSVLGRSAPQGLDGVLLEKFVQLDADCARRAFAPQPLRLPPLRRAWVLWTGEATERFNTVDGAMAAAEGQEFARIGMLDGLTWETTALHRVAGAWESIEMSDRAELMDFINVRAVAVN